MKKNIKVSPLQKTWIFDIDGTILKHNGFLYGRDELLPGVKEFFAQIPDEDYILLLTARGIDFAKETESFLMINGIRFNKIIYDMPTGERIQFNDIKEGGLKTAMALNCKRNEGLKNYKITVVEDM